MYNHFLALTFKNPHTHKSQNRDYFKGVSYAVEIVPQAREYSRALRLTAWCAVTLEKHEWLGVILSSVIKFNNTDKYISSPNKQGIACACLPTSQFACAVRSSDAICINRKMHFELSRKSLYTTPRIPEREANHFPLWNPTGLHFETESVPLSTCFYSHF